MTSSEPEHRPVLLKETLELLAPEAGERMLDGTVGLGGHGVEICRRLGREGLFLGIDRDGEALEIARSRLEKTGAPFLLLQGSYGRFPELLRSAGQEPEAALDGFLLDLGVSSLQLDEARRGFSFQREGPLDMRMDPSSGESAAEYLGRISVRELEDALRRFGEEKAARRVARAIDRARRRRPIETTTELASIVEGVLPRAGRRTHPATRTFQALRIAVNDELDPLRRALADLDRYLRPGGRAVVISYHSLEDRIVKQEFGRRVEDGLFRWMARGALRPSPDEVRENPRARSARLRAVRRAGGPGGSPPRGERT